MADETTLALAAKNYADLGSFTAPSGAWAPSLPLTNALDRRLSAVARSTTVDPAMTQFTMDLGKFRPVGLVSLIGCNFSQTATWQIQFSTDGTTWFGDTGKLDVWEPATSFGALPWGIFEWGQVVSEESQESEYPINAFYIPTSEIIARYVRILLFDANNPTQTTDPPGFVQFGRLYIGAVWRPSTGVIYPLVYEVVDDSAVDYSRGGQTYVDERRRRRVVRFGVRFVPEDEMMQQVLDYLDGQRGIIADCVLIPKPTQTHQLYRQAIYCRQRRTAPMSETFFNQWSRDFEFEELV